MILPRLVSWSMGLSLPLLLLGVATAERVAKNISRYFWPSAGFDGKTIGGNRNADIKIIIFTRQWGDRMWMIGVRITHQVV